MTIFFALVGVSVLGMGMVAFWMLKDKEDEEDTVEKIPPEKLRTIEYANLPPGSEAPKPAPKKPGLLSKLKSAKLKKESDHGVPMFLPDEGGAKPKSALAAKMGLNKILDKLPIKKHDAGDFDEDAGADKSVLKKILSKFKFGKKKDDDDVPMATSFPNLKDKLKNFSKDKAKGAEKDNDKPLPLLKDVQPGTGTASISTAKRDDNITMPMLKSDKPPVAAKQELSGDEQKKIESEVESATELAELKKKHETLEKLLTEKNSEMEKLKDSYETEVTHRKDFNKIKDLLEKELKEVKDRVKAAKAELSESMTVNENQQKRIKQLEEKATKLEKEILAKEEEVNGLKKPAAPAPAGGGVGLKAPEPPKAIEEAKPAAPPAETPEENKIDYTPNDLPPAEPVKKEEPKEAPKEVIPPPSEGPKAELKKGSASDISKFEESLGLSTGAPDKPAAAPANLPPEPQPEDDLPVKELGESESADPGFLKLSPDPLAENPEKPMPKDNEQDEKKGPQS